MKGALSQIMVGIGIVFLCTSMLLAQEDTEASLASSIVRSAAKNLEARSPEIQQFGLQWLALATNMSGRHGDSVTVALEDAAAMAKLRELNRTAKKGHIRALSQEVLAQVEQRLGWQYLESTRPLIATQDAEDKDWISISPTIAKTGWLQFTLEGERKYTLHTDATKSILITVFDEDKASVLKRSRMRSGNSFPLPVFARSAGCFVRYSLPGSFSENVRFALTWRAAPKILPKSESVDNAIPVEMDRIYSGTVGADYDQWLRFQARAGALFEVQTSNLEGGLDSDLTLYANRDSLEFARDDDGGRGMASRIVWLAESNQEFFVKVGKVDDNFGSFDIALNELKRLNFGNTVKAGEDPKLPVRVPEASDFMLIELPRGVDAGWISFATTQGTVYQILSSGAVSAVSAEQGGLVRVLGDSASLEQIPLAVSHFLALADGSETIRLSKNDSGETPQLIDSNTNTFLLQISSVRRHEELPAELALTSLASRAPLIELVNELGYVARYNGSDSLFAKIQAKSGHFYQVATLTLDTKLRLAPVILKQTGSSRLRASTDSVNASADTVLTWHCKSNGEYLLLFRNDAGKAGRSFLTIKQTIVYDGFVVGNRVILGRHRPINGSDNWTGEMEKYVGKVAKIVKLEEQESETDAYIVRVDIDNQRWVWRTRDMKLAPDAGK